MVKVFQGTENEYYMDGYLQQNFDIAKDVIKKDWDMVFCVDGYEGSGKSALAQQCAFYCDQTLDIDRIVFSPGEFKNAVNKAKPYQAIIYDEAYTGLSSRAAMSWVNKTLIKMLAEIRQKNLFIFVVMPCFFDLDKYVALWRSRALIHVYAANGFERGYFAFYNLDKKKSLYMNGKKFYSYSNPKPNFTGRFLEGYAVDNEEYRKKKSKASQYSDNDSLTDRELKNYIIEKFFIQLYNTNTELGKPLLDKDMAKIIGITREYLGQLKKKLLKGELEF